MGQGLIETESFESHPGVDALGGSHYKKAQESKLYAGQIKVYA